MAIPDFQSIMLPLLKFSSDQNEHSVSEITDQLAKEFALSEEELKQLLPSGNQTVFINRVAWAKAHLKMAGLIENTRRGFSKITSSGIELLGQNPLKVNLRTLKTIAAYIEHRNAFKKEKTESVDDENDNDFDSDNALTPEESFEYAYQKIRKSLAQDILSKVKSIPPAYFEKLVVELLVKMGYGGSIADAGRAIGKSGDEGIDGMIKEDRLGLDVIFIQAKRWENVVGRPELQKFVGALAGQGAKKGIFITTSYFTKDALEYSPKNETKIVLIDGEKLAQYMIDFDLGVSTISSYAIKRIDSDYFEED